MARPPSHVMGFDDGPFERTHRGDVWLVGTVFAGRRLEGVLTAKVRRDGVNSTRVLNEMVGGSRFVSHLQALLVQGIAFAGFNVIDLQALHESLGVPVVAVARRRPDLEAIRRALLTRVPGGARKWALIEKAGPMEPAAGVYVQRAGISLSATEALVRRLAVNSALPEPLRSAHLIAGALATGQSRHRP
ncbi:MAG: DUF99 family protein [Gammaproteobacteria bacterium]